MKRFYHEHEYSWKSPLLFLCFFLLLLSAFTLGINSIHDETSQKEREYLEQALSRGIAHCYATEGRYPESLDYLKEHYGITYNSEKYFVDYQIFGENMFPDLTIIEK